jgi:hypothetical protein
MDFLKKHYEKITLAAALILLIVSAVLLALKVSALSTELDEAPRKAPKPQLAPHIPLQIYSNAMQAVTDPPIWSTNEPTRIFNQDIYVEVRREVVAPSTNGLPILLAVVHKPFTLLFKTYSYDETKGEGYNFQLNFQYRAHTFFIQSVGDPIKDRYGSGKTAGEDTGYKVVKFEKKSKTVDDPALGGQHQVDVSELTVQHTGNNPKALVLGQVGVEEEPVALVRCDVASPNREYRRGQLIQCTGKTFKVVDMDLKQMVIVDTQTGDNYTIKSQQ